MSEIIPPPIETLPIEVGALILPDMDSLWVLIQASPHIYRIFSNFREDVLQSIIAREIGPVVTVEAWAAYDSSRSFTGEGTVPLRGPPKSQALDWMDNYYLPTSGVLMRWSVEDYLTESDRVIWEQWEKRPVQTESLRSLEDMLGLWDLHKDVKFLADIYVREALPIFTKAFSTNYNPPVQRSLSTLEDLSATERQRVFRGIYRLVIFGNLFAPSPEIWDEWELCERFLCRFPAWEVEELSCIYDFIAAEILRKLLDMKEYDLSHVYRGGDLASTNLYRNSKNQKFISTLPIKDLRVMFQAKDEPLNALIRKWASIN